MLGLQSNKQRYPPAVYIGATAVLLFLSLLYLSSSHFDGVAQVAGGKGNRCDPHDLPGVLELPEDTDTVEGALKTVWRPLQLDTAGEASCPPQNFVKRMASGEAIPRHLHHRTILLIGDSIDRGNAAYSCRILNGTYTTISPESDLWPQADIPAANGTGWRPNEYSHRSYPALCHVAEYDLLIANIFHFGLDDTGDYFGFKDQWGAPGKTESRIEQIALPLVHKLGRCVDIVEFSSGLWDLAHFGRDDDNALTEQSTETVRHLAYSRLAWYTQRYAKMLSLISSSFASQAVPPMLLSRKLHVAASDEAGEFQRWWQTGGGAGGRHTFYFPSWRVGELNNAMQAALDAANANATADAQWAMDTWGDKLFGAEVYEAGNVHPSWITANLWLEQMMYRLWKMA